MSGDQHLGWEALERIRTDEATAEEYAHLASCGACRDALADLERLASRFKESLSAEGDAIPAAREDAILSAARARATAIAGKKLVRLPWWKQRSAMALAASLVVAGSAGYLTHVTRNQPSPRPSTTKAVRSESDADRAPASAPRAVEPARSNEAPRQKKELGRVDGELAPAPLERVDELGKNVPDARPAPAAPPNAAADVRLRPEPAPVPPQALGVRGADATKGDAAKSKDANLAARDLATPAPPPASTVTAAPAARAPVPEPAKSVSAGPAAASVEQRLRALEEKAASGTATGGAAAGALAPAKQAVPTETDDELAAALDARAPDQTGAKLWLPPQTGLWVVGQGEARDTTEPRALPLVSTEIEVRVGDIVARRVRQRFANPSGQPVVATYSIALAPGERGADLSLTIGSTEVPPRPVEEAARVRVWQDLPVAGTTIDLLTLSPPHPLDGVLNGSVRIRIPVPPPAAQGTEPPKLSVRIEPAQGYRLGQPAAAGLAITGHPLGSGAWDLTLPPTLGVKEDLLELDVPVVRSGG